MTSKSYDELRTLPRFEDRFHYLALVGQVGEITFGSKRYENQKFYASMEWKRVRDFVIIRDEGRDLGVPGREIHGAMCIHHINPLRPLDIELRSDNLLDPNNLITVTHRTHNAIHYGNVENLQRDPVVRTPGDTKDW